MAVVGALTAGVLGTVSLTRADTIIDISAAKVQVGNAVIIGGKCPCFRWAIQAQAGSGKYETQDILISTDALLQATMTTPMGFSELSGILFKGGAIEVLSKQGHVGVGFDGVEYGKDADRGLKTVLRTGLYALVNMIQTDNFRLDGHLGWSWNQFVAEAGASGDRHLANVAVVGHWEEGPWSGMFSAHMGAEMDSHFADPNRLVFGGAANVRVRVYSFSQFEMGLTAQVSAEHDGFLESIGLSPNNFTGMILMDLSYVPDPLRQHTN